MERPLEKEFKQDPLKMIARDRAKYISAALTIPLGFVAAGMPNLPRELNGFSQWSRLVRAPLIWLGEGDAVASMAAATAGDARVQAKAAVLAAMADLFGNSKVTVAQIIDGTDPQKAAADLKTILAVGDPSPKQKALREALMAVAGAGKEIAAGKLGYWLRAAKGQIVGGLCLCGEPDRTRMMHWWVEAA
jgi:putative DNA primase/helicase